MFPCSDFMVGEGWPEKAKPYDIDRYGKFFALPARRRMIKLFGRPVHLGSVDPVSRCGEVILPE
jgi:hypothetical protein